MSLQRWQWNSRWMSFRVMQFSRFSWQITSTMLEFLPARSFPFHTVNRRQFFPVQKTWTRRTSTRSALACKVMESTRSTYQLSIKAIAQHWLETRKSMLKSTQKHFHRKTLAIGCAKQVRRLAMVLNGQLTKQRVSTSRWAADQIAVQKDQPNWVTLKRKSQSGCREIFQARE